MTVVKKNSHLLKFYTTVGCHLCEQAESMLGYLLENNSAVADCCETEIVEISESEDLVVEFGVRIPVLRMNSRELAFPFDYHQLSDWIIKGIKKDS